MRAPVASRTAQRIRLQPRNRDPRAHVRTEQSSWNRADHQRSHQMEVNIVHPKMEKAGYAG